MDLNALLICSVLFQIQPLLHHVFTEEELAAALTNVDGDIIRIKGYVHGEKGTLYFNYVLNEYHIYYGEEREDSLVSVIGTAIDEDRMKEVFHG